MSPRPDDVRLKQLQHEKSERIKQGIDKLERHSGNKAQASPKKGGTGGKGVWGSPKDDITHYMQDNEELA
ncbi:hypothetical protein ABBQ38_009026 [Trebouxia sp. C0009 RCD-2024]